MATFSKIHLSPSQQLVFYVPGINLETADAANKLLQENHDKHHIFFNYAGFHNHIAHHLLTLFALNATPAELRQGWDDNVSYQRPPVPLKQSIVTDMHDPEKYKTYLGREKYYHDFLVFFKEEIAQKGWQEVLNEYIFGGDQRADDMLVRMFGGVLHPIIHLGFGVEFEQPAIIAEALAQAAVHSNREASHLIESEKAARETHDSDRPSDTTIIQLLGEIFADSKQSAGGKTKYASRVHVTEANLEEKTAEMINAAVYFTGAAQNPPYQVKFDFFNIHAVNLSIFFCSFLQQPWLSSANKVRLLEWKIRVDLAMYASPRPPKLLLDEINNYKSKQNSSWGNIFKRVKIYHDDGHACKLIRALANGEEVCKKYEDKEGFIIKGDMWRKLGNMAIDSVEAGSPDWVRSGAWSSVPMRDQSRL
ncbi:hypothetical protein P153DRAFT_302625 [Dothidotthia symphoricarpi CBS 119687]|uniref:HypA-like protein n=1 Tax=Dothidotthia symphoricarpi CBS 119687 TaxID=1392245 RepID=A0A6A5ZX12_9PLEO|nr:uncharacterized protein P153DRAFT_302625 [Dothidotthia symphoricarpi CBS 119687]KAF2124120.1 hypothetical protein P153DRAFT_302625 [Dothidotthia symphoricarpi CBS 119687]